MRRLLLFFIVCALLITPRVYSQNYIVDDVLIAREQIVFYYGNKKIAPRSRKKLRKIAALINGTLYGRFPLIRVASYYPENSVTPQFSAERDAIAVCAYLIKQGVDCRRLLPIGFGFLYSDPRDIYKKSKIEFTLVGTSKQRWIGQDTGRLAGNPCTD